MPDPTFIVDRGTVHGFEIQVVGNTVAGENIGGLMYFSQQSVNIASGVIKSIDYATGNILRLSHIRDPEGRLGDRYGIPGLPTTYVIDTRGRIAAKLTGAQTVAKLSRAVEGAAR